MYIHTNAQIKWLSITLKLDMHVQVMESITFEMGNLRLFTLVAIIVKYTVSIKLAMQKQLCVFFWYTLY